MTKLKICGLTRPQDVAIMNTVLPDYIGFVFAKSRRQVDADTAKSLGKELHSRIQKVGVFVNEDPHVILRLCEKGIIDIIQLHGDEDAEYMTALKNRTSCPVIKAVRVQSACQITSADKLPCDYLLLDTYTEGKYGGSGNTFEWNVIPPNMQTPYFLAGGLHERNVLQALRLCRPYCVDISSGAESDGVKNAEKIRKIVQLLRSEK